MEKSLLQLFHEHPQLAVIVSLGISILVAVIGLLPSVFITAANILFFGFWQGTLLSFLGESIGAAIAFLLYRGGLKRMVEKSNTRYRWVKKLMDAGNKEAFYLVLSLRLIPFVPSGLVTFAAAIGNCSFYFFFAASSLGKLPALFMEAWSVYEVTRFGWQGKLILVVIALGILYWFVKTGKGNSSGKKPR